VRKPAAKKRVIARKKAPARKAPARKPAAKVNAVHKQLAMLRKKLAKEQAFRMRIKRDLGSLQKKIAKAA
jgi:hypothetical protein